MKKLILTLGVLLCAISQAAQERGNGGDGFLCQDGKVYFYDLVEMEKRYHITPQLPVGANWQEITGKLIDRLQTTNPSRALRFRQRLDAFLGEADFLSGVNLIDVPDTGIGFVPTGCELKQLLIQRPPKFPGERRYVVAKDLWDRLDESGRAVLVLHELILGDAIEDEHQTSESARYLNALITGDRLAGLGPKAYLDLLRQLGFSSGDYHGVAISVASAKWNGDQLLEAGTPRHVYIDQGNIHGTADCLPETGKVRFAADGSLFEFFVDPGCVGNHLAYSAQVEETQVRGTITSLNVFNNGGKEVTLKGGKTEVTNALLKISADRQDVWVRLEFTPSGKARSIRAGCIQSYDDRCPSIGEALYRDQWRKVSVVTYSSGKITEIRLEAAVRAMLGWQEVPVMGFQTDGGALDYFLEGETRYKFSNGEAFINCIVVSAGQLEKVKEVQLTRPFHFRKGGMKYSCRAGSLLGVSGRSLEFNEDAECYPEET